MDEQALIQLIEELKAAGITFEAGLTDAHFEHIQSVGRFSFPPDLRAFLQLGVPVSLKKKCWDGVEREYFDFPNWHEDPKPIIQEMRENILDGFCFDIQHCNFWFPAWGERPPSLPEACDIARKYLTRTAPPLIQIYAHRYIPTRPHLAGNPVFSMLQPIDVIHYGYNLETYLRNEFLSKDHDWGDASDYRVIPFWSQIVDWPRAPLS